MKNHDQNFRNPKVVINEETVAMVSLTVISVLIIAFSSIVLLGL